MDSMDFDNVKAEKAKALRRYNRFRIAGRCFRAAEVCVAILFIFWTFTRLPFAVQISGEFLRRIAGVISTHLFVFLLGNCIVLVLLTKSSHQTAVANAEPEIYQALVMRSVHKPSDEEEIVYEDKEVIVVTDSNLNIPHDGNDTVEIYCSDEPSKVYVRSKSDVVSSEQRRADDDTMMMVIPKSSSSLQRSETEKCMRISDEDNNNNKMNYPEDKLSNEEFQKTIEDFIAKQSMFRRQESSLPVLVHNKSLS